MNFTVGMVSLGCPKNQMDAEIMLAKIVDAGIEIKADSALADVVIVNTCGFINDAKQESIDYILELAQLKKEGQIKKIVVTGCMAERYQDEIYAELPECDAVLGLGANSDIVDALNKVVNGENVLAFPSKDNWYLDGKRLQTTPHFFAYLRISDGCNNNCTYCAIPSIRGPLRSREMENIVDEAKILVADGVKELVLVAQDTTQYGVDLYGKSALPKLLCALCEIEELRWIRLMYCYPEHITDELIDVIAKQDKIVKYIDLPIQHSSGSVLRAMNRRSDERSLREVISKLRNKVENIAIRTTLIVGFPGESGDDFQNLCDFVADVKFDKLGCFTYSPEEGTPAASMKNQVDDDVKSERYDILMSQQAVISERLNGQKVGKILEVLVESYDRYAESWFGRSCFDAPDIDGKVFFTVKKEVKPGDIVRVKITEAMDWDLIGGVVD